MDNIESYSGQFDPHLRCRSNTWPAQIEYSAVEKDQQGNASVLPKKSNSRRNAWGNLSYADLITKAILESSEKRLTLSQIYEWMVRNITYFKDKGDNNSSAGWKNSIRHNLSLHSRFVRVQNEGAGKSSWWTINPDAKPGKSPRRRTTSTENNKYERKRGRVKKKTIEQQRRNSAVPTPSPSSSMSENADSPIHPAYHVCSDYRARSNLSATSQLSPINDSNGTWAMYNRDVVHNMAEPVTANPYLTDCTLKDITTQGYPYAEPYRHYPTPPRGSPLLVYDNPMPHPQFYPPMYSSSQLLDSHPTSLSTTAGHMVSHLMSTSSPTDTDLNYVAVQGGLECDVDQVITHELSFDGVLDFSGDTSNSTAPPPCQRSWVH